MPKFLSLVPYHPPAYVQMQEDDHTTAAFSFSLSNVISSSSCICTDELWDGSHHCHLFFSLKCHILLLLHMLKCPGRWIMPLPLFALEDDSLGLLDESLSHGPVSEFLWVLCYSCSHKLVVAWMRKLLTLKKNCYVSEVLANIMSWVSQLLLEMWQKLRTQILSNGLLEFGHVIVYLSIPSFMSWWS